MNDPLTQIEDEKSQRDMGVFAYRMFAGAREDGASISEAMGILTAWFTAMLRVGDGS